MDGQPLRALVLAGPTACGKSALALALADRFPIEIVSMDSALVYRGMDIGTAKPSPAQRAVVAHHLIDICDPADGYSVGEFCRDALRAIADIRARGRIPLLVGGTFLYLRSLRLGLANLPPASAEIRASLDRMAEELGWPAMHARLADVDPRSAARIAPNDRQRIQRALEVHALTGQSLSSLQEQHQSTSPVSLRVLALFPGNRTDLSQRIERRFDAMVAAGFLGEVEQLRRRADLDSDAPALRTVGYRQLWQHLDGRYGFEEARERALAATRQLAKRQLTWLRADPPDVALAAFDARARSQAEAVVQVFADRA